MIKWESSDMKRREEELSEIEQLNHQLRLKSEHLVKIEQHSELLNA